MAESYTHWSQITIVKPQIYSPKTASRIAISMGLEAFLYSGDSEWYALDDEGETTIQITPELGQSLHNFRLA